MAVDDCDVIVFDVDGVLLDDTGRSVRLKGVRLLTRAVREYRVYIVTGRSEEDRWIISNMLREHGIEARELAGIFMRPRSSRVDEVTLKIELLNNIIDVEGCIREVHDNNPRVLDAARRLVEGALVLHYNDQCTSIRGKSLFPECIE